MLKVFLDANVILDIFLKRERYEYSLAILELCKRGLIQCYTSSCIIGIVNYILEKELNRKSTRDFLRELLSYVNIIPIKNDDILRALNFKDFEDGMNYHSSIFLDYFITWNKKDYPKDERILTPEEFLRLDFNIKSVPFLDLSRILKEILPEIEKGIYEILFTSKFVEDTNVKLFEEEFAKYCNVKHCIVTNSGTSALYLALKAIGIKPGDEVILPANTFIATAEAISLLGAKPVFVDIDEYTYTINPEEIEKNITEKTKAVIPVHLYGQCCDMDYINEIAEKYGLYVIEDACQAHGAEYKKRKAGSLGHIAAFSFYPSKNLGTIGEGGAITTNDDELAEKVKLLKNHGSRKKYVHEIIGGNFRLDEIKGLVLRVKLKYLDKWNNMRRNAAKLYNENLKDTVIVPYEASYNKHVYHLYVIRIKKRDLVREELLKRGVETAIHYPVPIHLQKAFMNISKVSLPITERISREILSLPLFPYIRYEEILYVCKNIKDIVSCL